MVFKIIVLHIMTFSMLSAAMVAEYKMDEQVWNGTAGEVLDTAGSNNGTAKKGAGIIAGLEGNGGFFDGVDDYVELANELSALRGTASLSVWIRTTQTGNDTMWKAPGITGVEDTGGGDDIFWGWIDASGHIGITVANDPDTKSTTLINDGRWHHAVFTRDESNQEVIVYINGVEEARNSNATGGTIGNTFNSFGRIVKTEGSPAYFKGDMDEVQIFDLVLTQSEVKNLYDKNRNKMIIPKPTVEYRMDECYWFGNAGGVMGDVKDSSTSALDGTSYASVKTADVVTASPMCKAGVFNGKSDYLDVPDDVLLRTSNNYTVSTWLKPDSFTGTENTFEVIVMKTSNYKNGFALYVHWDGNDENIGTVSLQTGNGYKSENVFASINANVWTHVAATYDGNSMRMYINGVETDSTAFSKTIANVTVPLVMGVGLDGKYYYNGAMDELKLFNTALAPLEINALYNNEYSGNNYDGTARTCSTCSTSIAAGTWELIGIPADLRTGSYSVAEVLSDNMEGVYGNDWRIYRRDYSDTNNSSWDTYLNETDVMEFGKGYWLGSKKSENWNVKDIVSVDYDSSNGACIANRCVEIDLKSVSLDIENGDDLVGTGAHRYNMTGFVGKTVVDWADCRLLIDGTAYTPSAAEDAGYIEKQIWQYNPGDGSADSNGYTTCDDITPGGCKLEPHKGFWIKLHGPTKNKTVKLLIPQE